MQKRQRGRTTCPLARVAAREAPARQKEALVAVATYKVRILAVKGKNGYGHAECVGEGAATWMRLHRPAGNEEIGKDKSFLLQGTGSSALGKKKR